MCDYTEDYAIDWAPEVRQIATTVVVVDGYELSVQQRIKKYTNVDPMILLIL